MKKNKGFLLLALLSILLVGCNTRSEVITPSDPPIDEEPGEVIEIGVASTLSQLQADTFMYEGTLYTRGVSEDDGSTVYEETEYTEGYISEDRYASFVFDEEGNEISSIDYFKNEDTGLVEDRIIDPTTNTVIGIDPEDEYLDIDFDDTFFNPFKFLEELDGTYSGNTVTFNLNDTEGVSLIRQLTGLSFEYDAEKAIVTIDSTTGDIEEVTLESEIYYTTYDSIYCRTQTIYTFTLTEDVEDIAIAKDLTLKEKTSDHEALENAFNSLREGNYKANVKIYDKYSETWNSYEKTYYFTSDMVLCEFNDGYNIDVQGFINYDDGFQMFKRNYNEDEDIVERIGTTTTYSDYYASYFTAPFDILPEMFTYLGDGEYLYDNPGTSDYLVDISPEYMLYWFNYFTGDDYPLYTPDDGTYIWKLNDDGTITITYDYTYIRNPNNDEYNYYWTIETTIYDIGTTDNYFDPAEFDAIDPPTSWEDEDAEALIELLDKHGITTDMLPLFDFELEDNYWLTGFDTFYEIDYLTSTTSEPVQEVRNRMHNLLFNIGWRYIYTDSYNTIWYSYEKEDGTYVYISLGFVERNLQFGLNTVYIYFWYDFNEI